jgi:hypothetical protein
MKAHYRSIYRGYWGAMFDYVDGKTGKPQTLVRLVIPDVSAGSNPPTAKNLPEILFLKFLTTA